MLILKKWLRQRHVRGVIIVITRIIKDEILNLLNEQFEYSFMHYFRCVREIGAGKAIAKINSFFLTSPFITSTLISSKSIRFPCNMYRNLLAKIDALVRKVFIRRLDKYFRLAAMASSIYMHIAKSLAMHIIQARFI